MNSKIYNDAVEKISKFVEVRKGILEAIAVEARERNLTAFQHAAMIGITRDTPTPYAVASLLADSLCIKDGEDGPYLFLPEEVKKVLLAASVAEVFQNRKIGSLQFKSDIFCELVYDSIPASNDADRIALDNLRRYRDCQTIEKLTKEK